MKAMAAVAGSAVHPAHSFQCSGEKAFRFQTGITLSARRRRRRGSHSDGAACVETLVCAEMLGDVAASPLVAAGEN